MHFRLIEGKNDILKYEGVLIKNIVYDYTCSSLISCLTQIFQVFFVYLQFLSIPSPYIIYHLFSSLFPPFVLLSFSFLSGYVANEIFFLILFYLLLYTNYGLYSCVANHFNTVSYSFQPYGLSLQSLHKYSNTIWQKYSYLYTACVIGSPSTIKNIQNSFVFGEGRMMILR